MRIGAKLGDKKLQYDINNEVAERPALSSWKVGKYEYLRCE